MSGKEKDVLENMHSQRIVVTFILLVLFGSTILQSCQSVGTRAPHYDLRFDATGFGTTIVTQHQDVTYEGELFVSNNETFTIQDSEFCLEFGKITVQDSSTLIIRNSTFTADMPLEGWKNIVLEDQSKLIIENATLISTYFCGIAVQDDAVLNMSHSTLQNIMDARWVVRSFNETTVYVNNSIIMSGETLLPSGIGAFGTSSVMIENSTIDGVWVWRNSTVSMKNSVIKRVRAGDAANVNITDSEIRMVELSGVSSARFTRSPVAKIEAKGNANIMLIDSHAGMIETHDDATVFVARHLPLLGLVTMHYTWVPIIQTIVIATIIAIVIIVLLFLYRKRARRVKREQEYQT